MLHHRDAAPRLSRERFGAGRCCASTTSGARSRAPRRTSPTAATRTRTACGRRTSRPSEPDPGAARRRRGSLQSRVRRRGNRTSAAAALADTNARRDLRPRRRDRREPARAVHRHERQPHLRAAARRDLSGRGPRRRGGERATAARATRTFDRDPDIDRWFAEDPRTRLENRSAARDPAPAHLHGRRRRGRARLRAPLREPRERADGQGHHRGGPRRLLAATARRFPTSTLRTRWSSTTAGTSASRARTRSSRTCATATSAARRRSGSASIHLLVAIDAAFPNPDRGLGGARPTGDTLTVDIASPALAVGGRRRADAQRGGLSPARVLQHRRSEVPDPLFPRRTRAGSPTTTSASACCSTC